MNKFQTSQHRGKGMPLRDTVKSRDISVLSLYRCVSVVNGFKIEIPHD